MLRQYELVELVKSYDPHADEDLLNRAYVFTMKVHGKQTRLSGDPYFSHPIEVAGIVTQLKLDCQTVASALLHDTIEDTDTTYEEIEALFGREIAELVNGVTKLSNIHFSNKKVADEKAKQAENFRKFFLATSKDIRVLLIKLADRLHNMRTIQYHSKEKQERIARETLEIYAPLAGRIGMQGFRDEFEDRAFAVLFPDARKSVVNRLTYLQKESGHNIERIKEEIQDSLKRAGIDALVYGRYKRPYSVWRKMERKAISFEQLSDIIGFRVIVEEKEDCYRVLGVLHSRWKMVPGHFKDYVSTPKRNGYQSIHTTVVGPEDQRVELQIRTRAMHEVAETGVAAHWNYKDRTYSIGTDDDPGRDDATLKTSSALLRDMLFHELRGLADLFKDDDSSQDFYEHTKMEMYSDQVFVFTPKGELIRLPRNATPIDFAYAVHTTIGDTCVGAKINGRHKPLSTPLKNGDTVEILCSKAQSPTPEWESMVVTGRARSAIRRRVKQSRREDFIELGRRIVEWTFHHRDLQISDPLPKDALKRLRLKTTDDVFAEVGSGKLTAERVVSAVYPGIAEAESKKKRRKKLPTRAPKVAPIVIGAEGGQVLSALRPGLTLHMGTCCHPVPGDRIVGLMSPGQGIVVHTIDCAVLEEIEGEWLDLQWQEDESGVNSAIGRIEMSVVNEPGVLGDIASTIARLGGNITNLRFVSQDTHYVQLEVDIAVENVKQLLSIVSALQVIPAVDHVERQRSARSEDRADVASLRRHKH